MKNRLFIVLISLFCLLPFRGHSKYLTPSCSKDSIVDSSLAISITTTSPICNYDTGTISFTPNRPIPPNVIYDVMYQGVLTSVKIPSSNGTVVFTNLAAGTYIVGYRDSDPASGFDFSPLTNYTIVIKAGSAEVKPTGLAVQAFCKSANATASNLVTNQKGVIWYDAATGGKVIPSATVLTNGTTYYGSLKEGICESSTRLAVIVEIKDFKTQERSNRTQKVLASKFSDYFTLYPNPVSNILSVNTIQDVEIRSLAIYDILGQSVIEVPNAKSVTNIDVSKLTSGNYFIKVQSNKGNSSMQFIKY